MSKKILVIGGSSLVGETVAKYAYTHNDLHLTYNENAPELNKIPTTKIDLLNDKSTIINLINELKPDVVIHTVAYPNVDFCESNPQNANLLHVEITRDIASLCSKIGAKLIYFSTDAVFDGNKDGKYIENDIPNPMNHYGKTKLSAEKIILQQSDYNVILRSTIIYGWHKKSRFTNWVLKTLKNNQVVTAFTDQFNTPTLVDDLAKSILEIINKDISGLFHAVGKTCLSRYDFAILLAEKFGFEKNLVLPTLCSEKKQIAPRPRNGCLDNQNLEKLSGYNFCDIDTGISYIFKKYQENLQFF